MSEELKVQGTPPEPVVEPQPTVGVDTGVEPVVEKKTYTEEEHQAELNRIAGKTRDEEREKARKDYEQQKEQFLSEIRPKPTQQQPSFFRQQAGGLVNRLREQGKIIDQDTVDAVAELLDTNISGVVDTHVRISHATRNTIGGILNKLEKDPNVGDKVKQYRTDIENQTLSAVPPQMLNEQSVLGIAKYVIGDKLLSGDLSLTPKLPKQVPEVPTSARSQPKQTTLTQEQKEQAKSFGLTDDEFLGKVPIKSTGGKKANK